VGSCSNDASQRLTEDDFNELSQFVLKKYRVDGIGLLKKRHEQKRVHSWDWPCICTTMKGYRVLDKLDEALAAFLIDSLLEQWKHAQWYWEIHHSLALFFDNVVHLSIWQGRELDIIKGLASAFLQIQKAESCNMFNRLCVLTLITHVSS
jgi:hypothetical protein